MDRIYFLLEHKLWHSYDRCKTQPEGQMPTNLQYAPQRGFMWLP